MKNKSKNILVFNCGSSSLKYRLILMPDEKELCSGEAQRINSKTSEPSRIVHREDGEEEEVVIEMKDHAEAFKKILKIISQKGYKNPDALGHRVVHGGDIFKDHVLLNEESIKYLEETQDLAPLHNPPAVALIKACYELYPDLPQAAVFDTAFHSTIPWHVSVYPIPKELREKFKIKKYGFHGTSHNYVFDQAAKIMQKDKKELSGVSCHLGSGGASLCVIKDGKSYDNTMGYSPLPGLVMSTRSGDMDMSMALKLLAHSKGDYAKLEELLNKKSGVLGLSDFSGDIRDILNKLNENGENNEKLKLTRQVYLWRIKKALGAYLALSEKPQFVIFTDTIGELVPEVRQDVCSGMEAFGLKIDKTKNMDCHELPCDVSVTGSKVRVLVIATNEEVAIARTTYDKVFVASKEEV